jgi:hypothetical protein
MALSSKAKSIHSIQERAKSTSTTTELKRNGLAMTSIPRKEISGMQTTSILRKALGRGIGARVAGDNMEIRVGALTYTLKHEATEYENGHCGSTYHQLSQINIAPMLSDGEYRSTLLHEVMHACAHFAGIDQEEKLDEEQWISKFSPTFLMVLADNPRLIDVLLNA